MIAELRPGFGTRYFGYDLSGNLTSSTDERGFITHYEFNAAGWLTKVTDPAGGVTNLVYDQDGNVTSVTDPLGNAVTATFDSLGRLVSRGAGNNTEHWHYDTSNRLDQYTDTLGRSTSYYYGTVTGRLESVTDALQNATVFLYDTSGRVTSVIGPDPDGAGDQTSAVTRYAYDAAGHTASITDALNGTQYFQYDTAGRLTGATDASGRISHFAYNTAGQVTSFTDPANRTTSYEYDAQGHLVKTIDPLNHQTSSVYNSAGQVTDAVDANQGVTHFTYDAAGNLQTLTDPAGNVTSWEYDGLNRVTTEQNGFGNRTYQYDAAGNLTFEKDRLGRIRQFQYQFVYDGRPEYELTHEKWLGNGGSTVRDIAYAYSSNGLLQSVTDPAATYTYHYDDLHRLDGATNNGTPNAPVVALAYHYDTLGRRDQTSATVNNLADFVNTYSYDKLNRVTRVTQAGASGGAVVAPKRVDIGYTASGEFDTLARYNDLGATQLVATSAYTYNSAGELTSLSHQQGSSGLAGYTWNYDAAGRITSFTSPDESTSYSYDNTDQLTGADHSLQPDEAYSYDANGNRTLSGYQTGPGNRMLSDGKYSYTYDAEGHRTQRTEIATGLKTTYQWDYRQRLTEVDFKSVTGVITKRIAYTYDAFDRLIAKQVDGNGDGVYESAERYVYDGSNIVLVADETGSLTNRYLHGPAVDQFFADEQLGGDVLWALSDNQGTVRDWAKRDTTTNTTTIVDHLRYDAYGQITAHTNPQTGQQSTKEIHYAYTGREWDAEVGLYYYRARWYDPRDGRFISDDPLGFAAGDTNVQRYVGNGPTNARDPSGLQSTSEYMPIQPGESYTDWIRRIIVKLKRERDYEDAYLMPISDGGPFVRSTDMLPSMREWLRQQNLSVPKELEPGGYWHVDYDLMKVDAEIERLTAIGSKLDYQRTINRIKNKTGECPSEQENWEVTKEVVLARYIDNVRAHWIERRREIYSRMIGCANIQIALVDQFEDPDTLRLTYAIMIGVTTVTPSPTIPRPFITPRTISIRPPSALPLLKSTPPNPNKTIGEWLGRIDDEAYIHLSTADKAELLNGVDPASSWVKFKDVKNMTIPKYKQDVVMPNAAGHTPDANHIIVVEPTSKDYSSFYVDPFMNNNNVAGVYEYLNPNPALPTKTIVVPKLPAANP